MTRIALELPATGEFTEKQLLLLNDRLRRIQEDVGGATELTGDLDAHGFRIINLGDATDPTDALNLISAQRRFLPNGARPVAAQTVTEVSNVKQQIVLTVPGTLGIQSRAAALVSPPEDWTTISEIVALLRDPPSGGNVQVEVRGGGRILGQVQIAAGQVKGRLASVSGGIRAEDLVEVNIIGVGLTFPGAGLTVMVRRG